MIESILIATDGSQCSQAAVGFGLSLASRLPARLAAITIVEDEDTKAPGDSGLALPAFPEVEVAGYYRARAEAIKQAFEGRAQAAGVSAACEILQGVADERIVEKSEAFDLVVIGRDGKNPQQGGQLIGSTVDAVVRKINKSAVVVPSDAASTGPIVLGFDGSPGSRLAANVAVSLANGHQESVPFFVDSKHKGRAAARFDEVRQLVSGLSVPVREASSTLGRPDVKLVDNAKECRASLIAMGAFGRNRITDYFLGSNAAAVVRTSPIAVLLAR
jgi:nucleotide-binding universal stress UspA family protein